MGREGVEQVGGEVFEWVGRCEWGGKCEWGGV